MKHLPIILGVAAFTAAHFTISACVWAQNVPTSGVPVKRIVTNENRISDDTPTIPQEEINRQRAEVTGYIKKGQLQLKQKQNDAAIITFKHALTRDPAEHHAYLGLVDAYTAKGDLASAVQTYRTLLYPRPDKNWSTGQEINIKTLMRFALLLNQTGQKDEALTVYRRALGFLNFMDNKPRTEYPLPMNISFDGSNADNVYSPARFEAAARTAIGMEEYLNGDENEGEKQLTQALVVQPRFGPAWLYKALVLNRLSLMGDRSIKKEEIAAAFDTAEQLVHGGEAKARVTKWRKIYDY